MKNNLKEVAKKLMLSTNEEVLEKLQKDFETIESKINKLKSINTDGIKPLTHPNEKPIILFREDIIGKTLDKEVIISNAPTSKDGHVTIEKVVK